MGGDRDGNPNVTAVTTGHVLCLQRARAAELYHKEVEKLLYELSHTGPVSAEMRAAVEQITGPRQPGVHRKVCSPRPPCTLNAGAISLLSGREGRLALAPHRLTSLPLP